MTPQQTEQTLYERVGGEAGLKKLVHAFYDRVLEDSQLRPFFEGSRMQELRTMQLEFFTTALGGPSDYHGRPIGHVHAGRGIGKQHLGRFVQHLFETLQEQNLEDKDIREIISRINLHADEITGQATVSD